MRQSPKPTSHKGHPKDSIHLLQGKPDHPLRVDLSAQPGGSEERWDCQGLTGACGVDLARRCWARCGTAGPVCRSHCVTPLPCRLAERADKAAISRSRYKGQREFFPPLQMRVL